MKDTINDIGKIFLESRTKVIDEINKEALKTYFAIGKMLYKFSKTHTPGHPCDRKILNKISKALGDKFDLSMTPSILSLCESFYKLYQQKDPQSLSLSLAHYNELMSLFPFEKSDFYEKLALNENLSLKDLKYYIDHNLLEKLVCAKDKNEQEEIFRTALEKKATYKPKGEAKDSLAFYFLSPKDKKGEEVYDELEDELSYELEDYLLGLDRKFMLVSTKKTLRIDGKEYLLDMVFYNKALRSYLLIKFENEDITKGHRENMKKCLRFYETEINDPEDILPFGIILKINKNNTGASFEYGKIKSDDFNASYAVVIPSMFDFARKLREVSQRWIDAQESQD